MDILETLTKENLFKHAVQLRNMDVDATSMEVMAVRMVSYLYEKFVFPDGTPACALIRIFKTHSYANLPQDLQVAAQSIFKGRTINGDTKCLTLLATRGENPQWNSRNLSVGHKAIPLIDQNSVVSIPMISQLIWQFGLKLENVIQPDSEIIMNLGKKNLDVFYVPQAINSPYIPAQNEFVIPYQINTVLGLGGMLPSGNIFAIILFTKVQIPANLAHLFKWVAMYSKLAAASIEDKGVIFEKTPIHITNISKNHPEQEKHLGGANFEGADLQGANLRGANLQGANLQGANLQGAIMPDGTIYLEKKKISR